ncbi:MAG: hypothetical protein OJF49_003959 [Ktedonobacterales bacterium]|jgi:Tol biopolymer transport system component|nr:MAG: hypothetical protein OJF49_003959 [Ktedonobacterales bacterium]
MKCEMAEVNLSAYLDGMLEPQLREDVASHLATCAACSEILADYRRYNQLITDLPRISPSESLRARIFESPEYLELLRDLERKDARAAARAAGHSHGTSPGWARVALQVAAVFALIVGSALLIKQGFFSHGSSTVAIGTQTYGNPPPSGVPLAAGLRLVYAHDGAIWSAPEHGVGAAQRLTSTGVSVGVWSVAPDGKHIAYVDLRTHTLHIVRSDGQSDRSIATLPADAASSALTMMAWAPNSQQLAYVTRIAGGAVLHVVNMNGSNGQQVIHQGGDISLLTWSQNSQRLAYVLHGATSAIQTYDLASGRDQQVAAQADPNAIAAKVSILAWLADAQNPTLTWATTATTSGVDSVFSMALGSASAQRLTQAGTRFASAAFSAARGGGTWLVATNGKTSSLFTISAQTGATQQTQRAGAPVNWVSWSQDGAFAAYTTSDGQLSLWTPGNPPVDVLSGVQANPPVWSPDGTRLAAQTGDGLVLMKLQGGGQPSTVTRLPQTASLVAVAWAPDDAALAISTSSGVLIYSPDGARAQIVDAQGAQGALLNWSLAG